MKRSMILSALAAIPLAATLALAGPGGECGHEGGGPGRHHGGHRGMMFEKHLGELGLSADQKKKVDAILADARKGREGHRDEFRKEYEKLHTMLEQEKPDEKAVFAEVDKIGAMKTAAHKAMLKTLLAVRAELTPEQREKLKEMRPKRGERRWHHKDRDQPKHDETAPEADSAT